MNDSFFTSRNRVDPQIACATDVFCNELIEAATRRVVKLHGPIEAARRCQRLADICAGAYVFPIEHWRSVEPVKPSRQSAKPPAAERQSGRTRAAATSITLFAYLAGMIVGLWIGATLR